MLRTVLIFWDVRNDLKIAPLTPPLPFYKNFFKAIALVKATIMQMITKKSRSLQNLHDQIVSSQDTHSVTASQQEKGRVKLVKCKSF